MPGIKRRDPHPEAAFPSRHVGERAGEWRRVRNLSQEEVAERMETLGHTTWRRQTVAQVEAAARSLTVDELVSLAMAVECTVRDLFRTMPLGTTGWPDEEGPVVDLGLPDPMPRSALAAVLGFTGDLGHDVSTPSYNWGYPDRPLLRYAASRGVPDVEAEEQWRREQESRE